MSPVESCRWIEEVMTNSFPLGVLKDTTGDKKDAH
jgi:hypothetical protein